MSTLTSFEKSLDQVTYLFKISGVTLDRSRLSRAQLRTYTLIHIFNCLDILSEWIAVSSWLVVGIIEGKSFTSLTYIAPCLTLTILAMLKLWYYIYYKERASRIIQTLKTLEIKYESDYNGQEKFYLVEDDINSLEKTVKILDFNNWFLLIAFTIMPMAPAVWRYAETGEVELQLPLLAIYPFDPLQPAAWPFVFLKQFYTVIVIVTQIAAIDFFLYICSTYIQINFKLMQHEIETLIPDDIKNVYKYNKEFENKIRGLIMWHKELLRCVEDLEKMFSVPTLYNFVSSSLLVCLNAFNITFIDNKGFVMSSMTFLLKSLIQIYLVCFYGDLLLTSSAKLSDAVYNSKWYLADYKVGRSLFIILIRTQKPCKLTACGFSEVNIHAFSKIISSAYSYFTLLRTAYYSGQLNSID